MNQPAPEPPRRLTVAQQRLRAAVLAGLGLVILAMLLYNATRPLPRRMVAAAHDSRGTIIVEGTVESIDDANKAANTLNYHGRDLDMFRLVDSSGGVTVYMDFDGPAPAQGAHVSVEATELEQRGAPGVYRLVASKLTPLP